MRGASTNAKVEAIQPMIPLALMHALETIELCQVSFNDSVRPNFARFY